MTTVVAEPRATLLTAPDVYGFPTTTDALLPWSFARERLERARNYWLATVRRDGRPHVTAIWAIWLDGTLYWDGMPTSRWARNLAVNSRASINLESGDDVVVLEGIVEHFVTDGDLAQRLIAAWDEKYGSHAPEPETRGIFRLRPVVARGWANTELGQGTRWEFSPRR